MSYYVTYIASEFSVISARFYRDCPLKEFRGECWNSKYKAIPSYNQEYSYCLNLINAFIIIRINAYNEPQKQVLAYSHPQILSSTLNQFVFPVVINQGPFGTLDKMQQDIHILPITYNRNTLALIVIKDASLKIHLKNTLMSIAAKFEQSSFMDMLTGCFNRRFLFKYMEAELLTAKRKGYNVICCMFDLDHFKKINDDFGHDCGDKVLALFAKIAKSVLRPKDYFFRYGGEEFLAVVSQISLEEAPLIFNRIRKKLEKTEKLKFLDRKITCSGGISYWRPDNPTIHAEQLISLADIQLYKAKTLGRNCLIMDDQRIGG